MSLESELATAVVQIYKDRMGRGPTRVSATLAPDTVVVRLRDALTPTERLLVAAGHADLVRETRDALGEIMRPAVHAVVARVTGRAVRASTWTLDVDQDTVTERVFLAGVRVSSRPPRRARPGRTRAAEAGSHAV